MVLQASIVKLLSTVKLPAGCFKVKQPGHDHPGKGPSSLRKNSPKHPCKALLTPSSL